MSHVDTRLVWYIIKIEVSSRNKRERYGGAHVTEKLLGIKEISEATGLPLSWLYTQAAAGRIPHLKLGKYLRFRISEVQAWLEAHRRGSGADPGVKL